MSNISIIVASGINGEIGKDNDLVWHNSEDLKRFKKLTEGNVVIMGRNTMQSLPKKHLPNRFNIVVSRTLDYEKTFEEYGNLVERSLIDALEVAKGTNKDIFIIGGKRLYLEALKYVNNVYITRINETFPDADVVISELNYLSTFDFKLNESEEVTSEFSFQKWIKI